MEQELQAYRVRILESVQRADKILVGLGSEVGVKLPKEETDLFAFQDSWRKKIQNPDFPYEMDGFYKNLKELLKDKDYYIISLCWEDGIYRTFDREDQIVTPCGTLSKLQCETGCTHEIYPYSEEQKSCPNCGGRVVYNTIHTSPYVEEGYMENFLAYKKWLQTTINKQLCILEFGVGMQYPSVIRFAFDKVAYYNQKCEFYRVNSSLYQHTAENKERGISIPVAPSVLFGGEGQV